MVASRFTWGYISDNLHAVEVLHDRSGITYNAKDYAALNRYKVKARNALDVPLEIKMDFPLFLIGLLGDYWGTMGVQGLQLRLILGLATLCIRRIGDLMVPKNTTFNPLKHLVWGVVTLAGREAGATEIHSFLVRVTKTRRLRDRHLNCPVVQTRGLFPVDVFTDFLDYFDAIQALGGGGKDTPVFGRIVDGNLSHLGCTTAWFGAELSKALVAVTGFSAKELTVFGTKSCRVTGLTFYATLGMPSEFYRMLGDWEGTSWKLYNRRLPVLTANMRKALEGRGAKLGESDMKSVLETHTLVSQ